ncbi:MAG: hypothetical protein IPM92_02655 [Saprospiraceae bacterium]|nr:hypothetical protein [Saprospiraceae bacterium]
MSESTTPSELNIAILAESLQELADALEHLSQLVLLQKEADKQVPIKEFSLLVRNFKSKLNQAPNVTLQDHKTQWASKHKRNFIKNWLKSKNIKLVGAITSLKADSYLFQAVDYLASHFGNLQIFYELLKANQRNKKNFTTRTTETSLQYIQTWCDMLKQHGIIDRFETKSKSELFVDVAEIHKSAMFINGYWLELLLRSKLSLFLKQRLNKIQSFDILSQLAVIKPDGKHTELDLMLMLNGQIYWFECKSGAIGEYYQKFNNHRHLLGMNEQNSFVLLPTLESSQVLHIFERSGMSCISAINLIEQLETFLLTQDSYASYE